MAKGNSGIHGTAKEIVGQYSLSSITDSRSKIVDFYKAVDADVLLLVVRPDVDVFRGYINGVLVMWPVNLHVVRGNDRVGDFCRVAIGNIRSVLYIEMNAALYG